jgi:hypothetical protein
MCSYHVQESVCAFRSIIPDILSLSTRSLILSLSLSLSLSFSLILSLSHSLSLFLSLSLLTSRPFDVPCLLVCPFRRPLIILISLLHVIRKHAPSGIVAGFGFILPFPS